MKGSKSADGIIKTILELLETDSVKNLSFQREAQLKTQEVNVMAIDFLY